MIARRQRNYAFRKFLRKGSAFNKFVFWFILLYIILLLQYLFTSAGCYNDLSF